ncbi:uncharacterized protein MONOS_11593 [Monocercomonoides exilis]|uniref:uncharacterized protein n=1 Tax=Monocercomonoides exilis TaxID=2049356 RepID=UPI00355AB49A|nr:hypothetical protein MONOS_11593 [Monocercomonoides exilis]|eukprot:MONOS_11593.1-p1 / transcript=MONOS_11593.1 / gene=MONOS_11593 / organism=Monocercomonoides_exilis_PA203 / gene_product=unspecified product / transcript_product=unspecified product / location=Mono_scaffold00590:1849-3071(-) / protein_length=363 / sequence_SO=supercontig / SO=protein_coding / is_pseudo=false
MTSAEPQKKRSIFQVMREYEKKIEDRQRQFEEIQEEVLHLKSEIKAERITLQNTQAIEEVKEAVFFERKKLENQIHELTLELERRETILATTTQSSEMKDDEIKQFKQDNGAEEESIREFLESHAESKAKIEHFREETIKNERQTKTLQFRKTQLLTMLALLKAAYDSDSRSVCPQIPSVPAEARLVTTESEMIPDVFFDLVTSLQQKMEESSESVKQLLEDKQSICDDLEEDLKQFTRDSRQSSEKMQLTRKEKELTQKRKEIEEAIERDEKERRRSGRPSSGLGSFAEEYREAADDGAGVMGSPGLSVTRRAGYGGQIGKRTPKRATASPMQPPKKVIGGPKNILIGGPGIERSVSRSHL